VSVKTELFLTLLKKAEVSSETPVTTQRHTRCHIPDYRSLDRTTRVKTSWILTNTNPTWIVTDSDEPRENSLISCVMDLWFLKLIPLAVLSSRCSYGDEVFPPSANSDETSDYPRVLRFAVCKALRFGPQK
jgi:hypothetical protein